MGWVLEILMINKQVSFIFLLTRVGPKFLDEKEASISYFLDKEGGSQKYGWKTRKYRVLRVGGCLKTSKLQESSMMSVPFGQTPPCLDGTAAATTAVCGGDRDHGLVTLYQKKLKGIKIGLPASNKPTLLAGFISDLYCRLLKSWKCPNYSMKFRIRELKFDTLMHKCPRIQL